MEKANRPLHRRDNRYVLCACVQRFGLTRRGTLALGVALSGVIDRRIQPRSQSRSPVFRNVVIVVHSSSPRLSMLFP